MQIGAKTPDEGHTLVHAKDIAQALGNLSRFLISWNPDIV
jgi:hypothetical protein